ncbi:prepilin-type N-terminal cleavage/methylation domain-containing protein [candidate division KSB1 bacterium]|nr:prepilin-type N-terminal cleavage/methylation domain-containing protein [candidate division KSB1 bacterium]
MLSRFHRRRSDKGFTLIEILIVVVIVAILAAISVPIYVEYVRSARASDAKTTINAVWQAAQVFYQDKGDWPSTIEELQQEKYLEIAQSTALQWTFALVGAPPVTITATSTEQMRGGSGHQVIYNVQDGTWLGYGLPEENQ